MVLLHPRIYMIRSATFTSTAVFVLAIAITPAIVERYKWEAFWDAPLNIPGGQAEHNDTTPPVRGVVAQPGLPRRPSEVRRATMTFESKGCEVATNGARLEVGFPGV